MPRPTDEEMVRVIKGLPRRLRQAFVTAHVEGKPLTEIAAELHVSQKRVEQRVTKALELCRTRLEKGKR